MKSYYRITKFLKNTQKLAKGREIIDLNTKILSALYYLIQMWVIQR